MRILVTGASGFVGSHLVEYLLELNETEVTGTYNSENSLEQIPHLKEKVKWVKVNFLDKNAVENLIKETQPDQIYHLAAMASAPASFQDPEATLTNNITAQVHVLEALRKSGLFKTKVLVVSSAEVYGLVGKQNLPINENTPFQPTNPYAVSKLAQDFLGLQYYLAYKIPVIRVRPFNHIGPRQTAQFAVASFAKKIVDIEKGRMSNIMKVGNLQAKRDFTDVKDVVRAHALVIEKGQPGEVYNIGSGVSYTMGEILDKMLALSTVKISTETDPSLFRQLDNPELVCNNSKIKEATGWSPIIPIEQTLKEILDYWRSLD